MQDIVIIARAVGMVSTVMTTPLRLRVARQQAAPLPRYRKLALDARGQWVQRVVFRGQWVQRRIQDAAMGAEDAATGIPATGCTTMEV